MFGGISLDKTQKTFIAIPSILAIAYCVKTKKSLLVSSAIILGAAFGGLIVSSFVKK
jgi:hypothetical protein